MPCWGSRAASIRRSWPSSSPRRSGPERLLCLMLPYRTSSPASRADAEEVVARLGCASRLVDISPIVDGYFGTEAGPAAAPGAGGPEALGASALRRGNFMARARMTVLYDASVSWGGLVVGTGNKTESLIGYTTLFGDSACAFNPVGDLYKTQVRQLSLAVGVPDAIVRKAPSADLWPGQTDEAEAGFTYHELDRLLFWMIDRRRSAAELAGARVRRGGRGADRADGGRVGVQAPGAAGGEARAAHGGRRLPLPAPTTRQRPTVKPRPAAIAGGETGRCRRSDHHRVRASRASRRSVPGRRPSLRRRDPDRQPRRRHAAGARGPGRRAPGRGRGHPPHAPPVRPSRPRARAS